MKKHTCPDHFKKKHYKRLKTSPLKSSIGSHTISSLGKQEPANKKIIATKASKSLREAYKELFLPLLIDVFQLRQIISNHKTLKQEEITLGKVNKSPQEVLEKLKQMQQDIEESKRWCDGVILQIERGIADAKETLELIEEGRKKTGSGKKLLLKLLRFFKLRK